MGGLWRFRNRAPQEMVGVGFTSQGGGHNRPYRRQPDSLDPRATFIFEGLAPGELIGDYREDAHTVGLTRDLFDAEGHFNQPGPGLELFDEMPGIQYRILAEQVRGCDAAISVASRWSERSLVGSGRAPHRRRVRPHRCRSPDPGQCNALLGLPRCAPAHGLHHHHLYSILATRLIDIAFEVEQRKETLDATTVGSRSTKYPRRRSTRRCSISLQRRRSKIHTSRSTVPSIHCHPD